MKKVLFIYRILPQYRVDFFQQLRIELFKHDIDLQLIHGKSSDINALKNDEVEIEWAKLIPHRKLKFGKTQLLWQPCLKHLKDKDLIIVQLEIKVILNYYLMFGRHLSKWRLAFWGPAKNMREKNDSLGNRFRFLFLKKCDWWFAYTKGVKKLLTDKRFPENKITVINNAIDTLTLVKQYSEITEAESNGLKRYLGIIGSKTGIFCGAMYPGKRLDFILEVCQRVKEEIPEFNMIFIGSGVEAPQVIEASATFKWVHYIGPKFGKERVKYFKISAIQLMPRLVGLSILDSFAMETPIITTVNHFHGAEFDYLENGVNGLITEDSVEDYSKAIIEILRSEKYRDLIPGCRLFAKRNTVENMVENFKNGILSCLSN